MRSFYLYICAFLLVAASLTSCSTSDPSVPIPALPSTSVSSSALNLPDMGGPDFLAAGDNDDWSGSACSYAGLCRIVGDVSGSTITGLDQSRFGNRDVALWFRNDGSTPVRFAHESTGSSSDNRIHTRTGEDVIVAPQYGILLRADVDWSTDPFTPLGWDEVTDNSVASVTHTTSSRALGAAFQPSVGRPVMGCYSVQISTAVTLSGGQAGRVELLVDAANPPTTARSSIPGGVTGTVVLGVSLSFSFGGVLCALFKPGEFGLLQTVDVVGSPSYSIVQQTEDAL